MTKLKKILDLTFNDIKLALFTKPIYMLKDRYIRIRLQENVVEIIKVKDGKLISNSISLIEFFNSLSKKEYHQTKDDRVIDNGNEAMTGEFGDYGASAPELNGDGWYNG